MSDNQARLNNGCVCNDGCPACDALAESWTAMREVLSDAAVLLSRAASGRGLPEGMKILAADVADDLRAALALAAKVRA